MVDLNDLRVFEKVASLKSFSAAARALGLPKSSVSRCVSRLEAELGIRLVQRTTHDVQLTQAGAALKERCDDMLLRVDEAIDLVTSLGRHLPAASRALAEFIVTELPASFVSGTAS
jgi:LysR family transcriptional regulator, regulator for bpeEF and oprC